MPLMSLADFVNMGIESYNFVASLSCILAQRLVRSICPYCRVPVEIHPDQCEESGIDFETVKHQTFFEGKGCNECHGLGFKGRKAITEFLDMTDSIKEMILAGKSSSEIRVAAMAQGMTSLRQAALEKVFRGETYPQRNQSSDTLLKKCHELISQSQNRRWHSPYRKKPCIWSKSKNHGEKPPYKQVNKVPLPSGVIHLSSAKPNIEDMEMFLEQLRILTESVKKPLPIAISLPDFCARTSVFHFSTFPIKKSEQRALLNWRFQQDLKLDTAQSRLAYEVYVPTSLTRLPHKMKLPKTSKF